MVAARNDVLVFKPVVEEIPDDKELFSVFFYVREKRQQPVTSDERIDAIARQLDTLATYTWPASANGAPEPAGRWSSP